MGIVSRIQLREFRNIPALDTTLSPGVNMITGANGQGKTSLLESIYFLAFLRSFRTRRPAEMIQWGSRRWEVAAALNPAPGRPGGLNSHTLNVTYAGARQLIRDKKVIYDGTEFINAFFCIALVPEDLGLIKGTPLLRRRFMDMLLCQMSRDYLHALVRYNQALARRNAMLKNVQRFGEKAVRAYDPILAETGARLTWTRWHTLRALDHAYTQLIDEWIHADAAWTLQYVSSIFRKQSEDLSVKELEQGTLSCLEKEFPRDTERRTTRYGPHRDDLYILMNEKSLSSYGSEGQCRLSALGLRLAAMRLLKDTLGDPEVVVLVDDVFGELDTHCRRAFFRAVSNADQVLITGTSMPENLNCSRHLIMDQGCLSGDPS